MSFTVTYRVKKLFFDRAAVRKALGKANAKALGKAGAFVRTRARSSLRRRKKPSAPGSPPSVHSRDAVANLKNILFAYDPGRQSVIVGPVGLNVHKLIRSGSGPGAQTFISRGAVPGTLEFGGMLGVRKVRDEGGQWHTLPFGRRRRDTDIQLIPVWKATPEQKAAAIGIKSIDTFRSRGRKGNGVQRHTVNFYIVRASEQPSRIFWANIAARPFMGPALAAEAPKFPSLWFSQVRGAA